MITICLCTQKGGVAKTTTAEALILGLRRKGYKVLGLDLDQQGNLTNYFLNLDRDAHPRTVFDLLRGTSKPEDIIIDDILPGGIDLMFLPQYFDMPTSSFSDLRRVLAPLSNVYDVLVIDTPPAINKVVMAGLASSDYVIMPSEPSNDSLEGLRNTTNACAAVKAGDNANLHILGVLLTKYKERYTIHAQFKELLTVTKEFPLLDTVIRESQAVNKAKVYKEDFFGKEYMHAKAVQDYRALIKEVIAKTKLPPKQ